MRIAIGSDHAGFPLKEPLMSWLTQMGHEVLNAGTDSQERTDYPIYGAEVGRLVASGEADFGVAICGSGQGICMAVNKVHGARGGILRDMYDAEMTRRHNNANVACLGARVTPLPTAKELLRIFFATAFEGGRHTARVDQLD
ncbi:MAG: ribose 5-phosphate isomerase B [Candidatus Nanopelagicales bacterium]